MAAVRVLISIGSGGCSFVRGGLGRKRINFINIYSVFSLHNFSVEVLHRGLKDLLFPHYPYIRFHFKSTLELVFTLCP